MKTGRLFALWVAAVLCTQASNTHAANINRRAIMTLTAYETHYKDIKASDAPAKEMPSSYDVELTLRLVGLFSVGGTAGQSEDGLVSTNSAGIRVETPGYFFVASDVKDYRTARKRYPVNTSIFAYLVMQKRTDETTDEVTKSVGSNFGFGMDIFLFQPYTYLATQASVYNMEGNAFLSYAVGLGFQF